MVDHFGVLQDGWQHIITGVLFERCLFIEQLQTTAFVTFQRCRVTNIRAPTSAFIIDLASSQGLEGMIVDSHCVIHVLSKELDEKHASLCTQTLDNLLLDVRVSSLSLLMKQMLHPCCERVTRRATTQRPIFDKGG